MKRHIGLLLIIIGIILAAIPLYRWAGSAYYQRVALAALEDPVLVPDPVSPPPEGEEPVIEPPVEPAKDGLPDYLGVLEIPKINIKVVVVHGVTQEDLKKGPGFYPQSSHPEIGNVSIASHRGSYGAYFLHLNRLKVGDEIKLTLGDTIYMYKVRANYATHSRDWSVIDSTGKPEITLTTCIIADLSTRLIIKGDLVDVIKVSQPNQKGAE